MTNVDFKKNRIKWRVILSCLSAILILTVILSEMVGIMGPLGQGYPERIPVKAVLEICAGKSSLWPNVYKTIVLDIRLPRIVLAALVGCALSVSGTTMQGLFKNPMADPFIIGLASGGALGGSLSVLSSGTGMSVYSTPILAFIGAMIAVFSVYLIAQSRGKVRVETLLLTGIAVGSFLTSLLSLVMYSAGQQFRYLYFWLLGGLYRANWEIVTIILPPIICGTVFIHFFARDLNAMVLGEEPATHLGIDVELVKKILLISTSLVSGVAVAFSGIIGFVGLIVPHTMRLLVGPDHRILLPSSALAGGIFLIWADTIARTILAPTEIPVGIITAFCGAPFFLYLLQENKKGRL